jgi:hypothetical protein
MKIRIYNIKYLDKTKINTTIDSGGRFGNIFIRNMISSRIARQNNLKFLYENDNEITKLGVSLYKEGTNTYNNVLLIDDSIIDQILFNRDISIKYLYNNNILFKQHNYSPFSNQEYSWCQTTTIAKFIKEKIDLQKENIISLNPFNENYKSNNNVFIHIRLGDTVSLGFSTAYNYYDNALSLLSFEKGYISSDNIDNEICVKLIKKYGLLVYSDNEVNTIQFASTNKYIILSSGTFSFLIGLFGFFSEIYYPKIKVKWHGDIFVFPEWKEIDY